MGMHYGQSDLVAIVDLKPIVVIVVEPGDVIVASWDNTCSKYNSHHSAAGHGVRNAHHAIATAWWIHRLNSATYATKNNIQYRLENSLLNYKDNEVPSDYYVND